MANLEPLAQVLPGLRGADILEGIFSGDDENGGSQLKASNVFVQPPHIIVSTDQGRRLIGFDSVVPAHAIESDDLFGIITARLQRKPDVNKTVDLEEGILAFRTTDRVVSIAAADTFGQTFYLICRSRVVKVAKFDSAGGKWTFESRKDFLLGDTGDDSSLVSVCYCLPRSTFIWIVESKLGVRTLYIQQHSALTGLSPARSLMTGLPECELHLVGDTACVVPDAKLGARRQLHFWNIAGAEPMIYYSSVGQLQLPTQQHKPSGSQPPLEYQDFFIANILPILLQAQSANSDSELLAIGVNTVKKHLLTLTRNGTLSAVYTHVDKIVTVPICKIQNLKCEGTPQVMIHQNYVVIIDGGGCRLHHISNGLLASNGRLSSAKNLRLWQGTAGVVNLCGVWSPTSGLWQLRSKPVHEQAEMLIGSGGDNSDGALLAADLCSKWNVPEIAGKFAVNAIRSILTKIDSTQENKVVASVAALLPHLRKVQASPLLLITIIGKTAILREMLLEEIRMHYLALNEDLKSSFGVESAQMMGSGVTKKYAELAEAYSSTLLGGIGEDDDNQSNISQRVQDNVMELLLSTAQGLDEDGDLANLAEVFRVYVEQAPRDVLVSLFEYLELSNALADGFPEASEAYCNVKSRYEKVKFTLFTNSKLSWTSAMFEDANHKVFLFDMICQMLMTVQPSALEPFVKYATKLIFKGFATPSQEAATFKRVVSILEIPEQKTALSKESARVYANIFRRCKDSRRAIRILIQNQLWENALAMLESFKTDEEEYTQHYQITCEEFRAMGKLGIYASRIFNSSIMPKSFSLQDMFDLFHTASTPVGGVSKPTATGSPIVATDSSEMTIATLRSSLAHMLQRQTRPL